MTKVIKDLTEVQKTVLKEWMETEYIDLSSMLNSFFECVKAHQIGFGDNGDNLHLEREMRESIQKIRNGLRELLNIGDKGSIVVKSNLIQFFDANLCFDYKRIFPLIAKTEIQFIHCNFSSTKEDLPIGWEGSGRIFEKKLFFHDCTFEQFISFSSSVFKEVVEFNNSIFVNGCDFHECTFEKNACFYGVDFKGVPNFSQANFLQKINLVNTNLNFSFEECKKLVESEKERRINQRANTAKMGKPITGAQIANDFRDSFEVLKSKLLDVHDEYEAEKYRQIALYFREIGLEESLEKITAPSLEKIKHYFFNKNQSLQKNNLNNRCCAQKKKPSQISIFIEKNYLSLLRQIYNHRISEISIVHILVLFTLAHFSLINLAVFCMKTFLVDGTQSDIDFIAKFLLCSLNAWIVIPIIYYFVSKTKVRLFSQLVSLLTSLVVWCFAFNIVWLHVDKNWIFTALSVGLITVYFICFYIIFLLLKIKFLRYAISFIAYISLIYALVANPYMLYPVLGKFDEVKIENQLLDDYIQKTPLKPMEEIIKGCHILNKQIDWEHDQYEQVRKTILSNSVVFLTNSLCAKQVNNDFSILILKNQVLSQAIRVVNTIYFMLVVLLLFVLGKVAAWRWGGR